MKNSIKDLATKAIKNIQVLKGGNLVDNGGFEASTGKPKKLGQID